MYNAANRKDVRRAEKDAKFAEQQRQETIVQLMSTISGRMWVLEKLEQCHIFATSYSKEALTMAFFEGQRDIGLKLLNDIMSACPDNYILMMRENNERRASSERAGVKDSNGRDQGSSGPIDPYSDPDSSGDETGSETGSA